MTRRRISWFLTWLMATPSAAPHHWPMTVASAAPATPMAGKPSRPKIMMGSKIILMTAPAIWLAIWYTVLPVDCKMRSNVICRKQPPPSTVTMRMYTSPPAAISGTLVNRPRNQPLPTAPAAANTSQVASVMNTPFSATFSAPARSFWPRRRDKRALMPVAVPTATATIRFCTGNTRFTLASAFSLSMATKMLSTTL